MTAQRRLTVVVVSDVVCPWCYLGKRRLEAAAKLVPEIPLHIRWHPFQLDPTIPPEGIPRADYVRRKFGSSDALDRPNAHLTKAGAEVGIPYAFDRITRSPNTIDAHRLIRWAAEAGHQDEMVERLFHLYFAEGADVGDHSVLTKAAADVGMDAADVAAAIATGRDRDAVQAEINAASAAGVTGVPCFIFDGHSAVMGAQSHELLASAIRQVAAARDAATA
jgi:predicted DsbA family dithiol-disulfide isomerase